MKATSSFGLAIWAAATLSGLAACVAAPRYTDLRRIGPIHGDVAAGATKATLCVACHGVDGTSVAPNFPRLAGQREEYLYHRLVSFRHADPKDPYYSVSPMTGMAANLSEEDMRDLAAWFARQTPKAPAAPDPAAPDPAAPSPAAAARSKTLGETLYRRGDPAHGIPPCQGCHGAKANGPDLSTAQYAAYPVLRGQYSVYVTARLIGFRTGEPADTSNAFIMHGVASALDDQAIEAIGAWLASLEPGGTRVR